MNKTVVISGANRGIGLALTKIFLQSGFDVIAGARHPDKASELMSLAKQDQGKGTHCRVLALDVGSDKSVDAFAKQVQRADILINNAGISLGYDTALVELKMEDVEHTFAINVVGAMRVTKALLPKLPDRGGAVVANISSLMGSIADNASGGGYAYRISKAALNMFTKTLAVDSPQIIAVALHPGWVQTDMGGPRAPVSSEASAAGLFKVITGLTPKASGAFLDYLGKSLPW